MGYTTPQGQIREDDSAREATKRVLKDIKRQRGLRYAGEGGGRDCSRQIRSPEADDKRTKQRIPSETGTDGTSVPVQPGLTAVTRSNQHFITPRPLPKAKRPGHASNKESPRKIQKKSPLARLEQTLETLSLGTAGAEAQFTTHPRSLESTVTTPESQPRGRTEGAHKLHGYGRPSKGRMTPKCHSSSNSESGVATPRSNSSMPLKEAPTPKETGFAGKSLHEAQEALIQEFITCPTYKPFELLPSKSSEEYYATVKTPMSLHRVLRRVKNHEFKDWQSFEECVSLVWNNARLYYKEGHQTLTKADDLKRCFTRRLKDAMIAWEMPSDTLQHVDQDGKSPNASKTDDQTLCDRASTRCTLVDESVLASPAPSSVIFSDMMVENLKCEHLDFSEIMRVVDEGWRKMSPTDRQAFEQQASKTAAAREETASAVAVEVDRDKVLAKAKKELVDRLMQSFYKLLGSNLQESSETLSESSSSWGSSRTGHTSEQNPGLLWGAELTDGNEGHGHMQSMYHRDNRQTPSNLGLPSGPDRKRRRTNQEQQSDDEDEDGDDKHRKPPSLRPSITDTPKRFACPFSKRFPTQPPKSPPCVFPGFSSVHRAKEPLYRVHRRPEYRCLRCYEVFYGELELKAHARAVERCPEGEEPSDEQCLDPEQVRKLRNRKRYGSEEDRWRSMFMVCFPEVNEAEIPSPYCEHQRSPSSHEFERFEQFQRERLPQRVRRRLEHTVETDPQLALLAERWAPNLIDIIRECQEEISEEYHFTGGTSSRVRNQNHTPMPRSVPEAQRPVYPNLTDMWDFSSSEPWEPFPSAGSGADFAFTGNGGSLVPPPPDTTYGSMSQDDSCTHISISTSDCGLPIQRDDSAYASRTTSQGYSHGTGVTAESSFGRPYRGLDSGWHDPLPAFHGNFGEGPSVMSHYQTRSDAENLQYIHHDVSDHQDFGAQFDMEDAGGPSYFTNFQVGAISDLSHHERS